jgi:NADH-quinone oxidoreductase subunit A
MSDAVTSSLGIVAYFALFFSVGLIFIFVNLLVGRFVRPSDPHAEKLEIYECGEPTIGSSFVQFDLRFYVVALLFIIFDVEVAFFFPWAVVFGKSTHLMNEQFAVATENRGQVVLTDEAADLYRELGVRQPAALASVPPSLTGRFQDQFGISADNRIDSEEKAAFVSRRGARQLVWITMVDIGVFFGVLLVGFAYVWKRGDLNWVRAISREQPEQFERAALPREAAEREPMLTV